MEIILEITSGEQIEASGSATQESGHFQRRRIQITLTSKGDDGLESAPPYKVFLVPEHRNNLRDFSRGAN